MNTVPELDMCGIAGLLGHQNAGSAERIATVRRMTACLAHRGPDGDGIDSDGPVALGHRRLAIIDLSPGGAQPMASSDGRYRLVYNGELYNFRELRAELVRAGCGFHSDSDTEVVLQSLVHWGVKAACHRFNGMFALALWDGESATLTLARDRFGIKPLYHAAVAGGLAFASEIKALALCEGFDRSLDDQGLAEYLQYGNALDTTTLFRGARKLAAGGLLSVRAGEAPVLERWWTLADLPPPPRLSHVALVERVRDTLEAAVARHLVADVPVALFLSGGLDSSSLAAFASRRSHEPLRTVSVEFGGAAQSELAAARQVAQAFGTDHEERHLTYENLADVLDEVGAAHDQPFGDAANVPLYILARDGAAGAKVVLQGDGGDEMFGGYRRYALLRHVRAWRAFARLAPMPRALAARSNPARRLRRMQDALGARDGAERSARLLSEEHGDGGVREALRPAARARLEARDPFAVYRTLWPEVADQDAVQAMLHIDTRILLPDIFLEKVDRATMAHGIEVRVPFLDTELADLAMALPARTKLAHGPKGLLREAMRGVLPEQILSGPKLGFGVPYGRWLAGPLAGFLRERLLRDGLITDLFERPALERWCNDHIERGIDRGFLLYKLLMLSLWAERHGVRAS